jgi:predicted MFS family arabinose efflux permease
MICLTVAMAPLGGLAGGWIAEHLGLRATLLLSGLGAIALVPLVAWTSPLMRLRGLAETPQPQRTESVAEELAG